MEGDFKRFQLTPGDSDQSTGWPLNEMDSISWMQPATTFKALSLSLISCCSTFVAASLDCLELLELKWPAWLHESERAVELVAAAAEEVMSKERQEQKSKSDGEEDKRRIAALSAHSFHARAHT